jgi:hypothetical protein
MKTNKTKKHTLKNPCIHVELFEQVKNKIIKIVVDEE